MVRPSVLASAGAPPVGGGGGSEATREWHSASSVTSTDDGSCQWQCPPAPIAYVSQPVSLQQSGARACGLWRVTAHTNHTHTVR